MKTLLIFGGSGFLGSRIAEKALETYRVISADLRPSNVEGVEFIKWDGLDFKTFEHLPQEVDVVMNLAGASIFGRWTAEKKRLIRRTRIELTQNVANWMLSLETSPRHYIQASAIGYYGDAGDELLSANAPKGEGFLADTVEDWEATAEPVRAEISTTIIRNGIILGKGGMLDVLVPLHKKGLGAVLGSGEQFMSWAHIDDLAAMYLKAAENEVGGILHGVCGEPVRQKEFANILSEVLKRPRFLIVPAFALRLLQGQFGKEILYSQRAEPSLLIQPKFTHLEKALTSIVQGWHT
jgi:hypothetical protein